MAETQRTTWEARWSQADFAPPWAGRGVSAEVVDAIDSAWLPGSGRVLDVGCGAGALIAWFHQRGYDSVGVDIAPSAIAVARACRQDPDGGPRFLALDICDQAPPGGPFDIIIDRGCLHGIPSVRRADSASRLASASHDRTRMLLFMRICRGPVWVKRIPFLGVLERWRHRRMVARVFQGRFTIDAVGSTDLRGPTAIGAMPGVVYYLTRCSRSEDRRTSVRSGAGS